MRPAVFFACAIASLVPRASAAFQCTTTAKNDFVSIRWHRSPIPYAIRTGGLDTVGAAEAQGAVDRSFRVWATKRCSHIEFDYRGVVSEATKLQEVSQVIFVREDWTHARDAVGLTTMTYSTIDGTISHGKIEINDEDFDFADAATSTGCDAGLGGRISGGPYDLAAVLTHEVGHFLGLAHVRPEEGLPLEGQDAPTMSPTVPPCEVFFRDLESDDIDGLCFIYPVGLRARGCPSLPDQNESYVSSVPFSCTCTRMHTRACVLAGRSLGVSMLALMFAAAIARACSRARSGR